MKLSEQIPKLRREKGLSQEKLSEHLGISRQAVSRWETGESTPDLNNLTAMCEILGTTPNELLGFCEENVNDMPDDEQTAENEPQEPSDETSSPTFGRKTLLVIVIVLSLILNAVLYGFMNHYKDKADRDTTVADTIPYAVGFENISYEIVTVTSKVNDVTVTFKPTYAPDGATFGVLAKTGGKNNAFLIDEKAKLSKDGIVSAELSLPKMRGDGEIIIYMIHDGICTSQTVYSFVHTNDNYKVEMTPMFE